MLIERLAGHPHVASIPPGVPFLRRLAETILDGTLVSGFNPDGDPLRLADVTIYLPTRRAVRELRAEILSLFQGRSIILPTIRALGEFEDDDILQSGDESAATLDLDPPVSDIERLLMLAPLVQAWKSRLPGHVAMLFEEGIVVPTTLSDSLWLARDLAGLMDEVETEEGDWNKLAGLVPDELATWWQVTLEFLTILTAVWPQALAEIGKSNPAAHRNARIEAEIARLKKRGSRGPVIAAGSTGSIPATARLLATIARLDEGAVVLPGLDLVLDDEAWNSIGDAQDPSSCGHPQFGLKRLLQFMGVERRDVREISAPAGPLAARNRLISAALLPAAATDRWVASRDLLLESVAEGAVANISLTEAANERDEAALIAIALRHAISEKEGATAALITPDRALARRVSSELQRFGIRADDSGARALSRTVPAQLMQALLTTAFAPSDPLAIITLIKHPFMLLSLPRGLVKRAAEFIELLALRGGVGRPEIGSLSALFETRLSALEDARKPFWFERLGTREIEEAREMLSRLETALIPLLALREQDQVALVDMARASVAVFEALGRQEDGCLDGLYRGEEGEALAGFLRELVESGSDITVTPREWPDVFLALIATHMVKPVLGGDDRIAIWSPLEARLQTADTLVLGGLNEGGWPQIPSSDRFLSRMMMGELSLMPPERQIGLAAHDFMMALGAERVVLTRAARAGNAPAVASRWLQRLLACVGPEEAKAMRLRGQRLLDWEKQLSDCESQPFAARPEPKPPVEARPTRFSVTEIETHRRDPYAIYARRILELNPLDPIIRDPGAAERGTLFHDALDAFTRSGRDVFADDAVEHLLEAGRQVFAAAELELDIHTIWWPRFVRTAESFIAWERSRPADIRARLAEIRAKATAIGKTGATLSGRADRIDILGDGTNEIIDYKTGSNPSKVQAHRLIAPQLALEAALAQRGAFEDLGDSLSGELTYVRLRGDGSVESESILKIKDSEKTAAELAHEAWERLENLIEHYQNVETGYLSRVLPFREGDLEGDYDHLARVLEWSAGHDGNSGEDE